MKKFYLLWAPEQIFQILSEKSRSLPVLEDSQAILQTTSGKSQTLSAESSLAAIAARNKYLKVSAWRDAYMLSRKTRLDKAEKDWW